MRYQEGRNAFEGKNYEAAIQYFESLLSMSTTHSLADNAQYWIGESHYALRQYDAAIIDFEKVLTFPKSNKNVDSQFKLGMCYMKKGNSAKAAEEFERLNADYPGNRFESRVNQILSGL
jgi:tol-pal system protein YbgF